MKRILALALVLVLVLGMTVTASAEGTLKFVVSSAEAAAGEKVSITVNIEDNPGFAGAEVTVEYDENVLEWTARKLGAYDDENDDGDAIGTYNGKVGERLDWFSWDGNVTLNDTFVTLTFQVKEDAPSGDTEVKVSAKIWDWDEKDLACEVVPGTVTIKGAEPAVEDGFYLAGGSFGWDPAAFTADNKFETNPENTAEYMLATTLAVGDSIKAVKVEGGKIVGYYPDPGDNYTVDEAHSGDVTVYFNPNGNSGWGAFGGYIWINAKVEPKTQIELYGASATLGGQIGLNFFLAPTEEQIADEGFKVTLDGAEFLLKDAKTRTVSGKTLYQFTVTKRAKQMNEQVEMKAFDGNGEPVALYRPTENAASESFKFSVVDYVKKAVDNRDVTAEVKDLAKAMSDFGSLTQLAVTYKTDDRAELYNEAKVLAVTADDLAPYKAETTEEGSVLFKGSTLVLDDQTDLRIYLEAKEGALTDYTYELDGKAASLTKNTCVEVSNIAASKLDLFHTLVVKNADGETVLTVKICALSYAYSTVSGSTDQNLINAVKALFVYNQAADAYFK